IVLIGNERDYRGATQDDIYVLEGREGFFQQLSETWDFQIGDVLLGDMRLGEAETGPVWSQIVHIFSLFVRKKGPHNYAQLIWKGTWKYFMMKITMYLDLPTIL